MSPAEVLDRADALLDRERAAITAMRAEEVERLAEEKESLFGMLGALHGRPEFAERVAKVAVMARRNCLLLAHARDCAREAIGAVAGHLNTHTSIAPPGFGPSATAGRRGLKLSVTG